MKRIYTILLCLSLLCLFLLSACGGAGHTAESGGDPQEEGRDQGSDDTHDDKNEEPSYVSLSALYPWVGTLAEKDILRIRVETAAIGVAPGHFRKIAYSDDRDDISKMYADVLTSSLQKIPDEEGQIDGGGYVKYDIYTETETFSLTFSNQTVYVGEAYYRLEGTLCKPTSPRLTCNAFITYAAQNDIYYAYEIFACGEGGGKLTEDTGLGLFEFKEYTGACDLNAKLRLTSETVELRLLSETLFTIEGDGSRVYQITGEKDFSDYFDLIR